MVGSIPQDPRVSRFLKDVQLCESFNISFLDVKKLKVRDRSMLDWYLYCKSRKLKQKM